MLNDVGTIEFISKALDAAIMRHTAIANNIAQANTEGYRTIRVHFEEQLQQLGENDINAINPYYEQTETPVSIDTQIAQGIQNNTQFRALIKGINHKFALMALALQGNTSS
jgi:flagellar basal-body rod protein FlgB